MTSKYTSRISKETVSFIIPSFGVISRNKMFKSYNPSSVPSPLGPYSTAVQVDRILYLSGALGLDKNTSKLVPGGTSAETKKTFENIRDILSAVGSSLSNVVSVKVYLDDLSDGPIVNEIYKEYLKPPYPARCMMEVSKLPLGAKIEVEVTAVIPEDSNL